MKILISDSGSTKTDWCVAEKACVIRRIFTKGINPFFQTVDEISEEIEMNLLPQLHALPIGSVLFYGAGCAFPEKNEIIKQAFYRHLDVPVEVGSDLLGAARALCGTEAGIACILGTGSNSCFYDGKAIVRNISPLGFILGDEGSGAVLGKVLVGDILKNQLPVHIREKFFSEMNVTPQLILENVYRKSFPNRFLAGLSLFLVHNLEEPAIRELVAKSFYAFFVRNVMQYDYLHYPVHLMGSVAVGYEPVIREVASSLNIRIGTIIQSPMSGLIAFHTDKNEK